MISGRFKKNIEWVVKSTSRPLVTAWGLKRNRDLDAICEECQKIPWESIADGCPWRSLSRQDHRTLEQLAKADCKVCLLIARAMSIYAPLMVDWELFHYLIRIRWVRYESDNDYALGAICIGGVFGQREVPILTIVPSAPHAFHSAEAGLYPPLIGFHQIKGWIQDCEISQGLSADKSEQSHASCRLEHHNPLISLRVIDCDTKKIVTAPDACTYVALSYVWGSAGGSSDEANLVLPQTLPRTIEDSITVTKLLGYRYLWIDKYCIEQDNSEDKQIQMEQMGNIYASADITIIAAAGKDPSFGLPGVSLERTAPTNSVALGSIALIPYHGEAIRQICDSVWASRAWVFQEGWLSRRRLYFTEYQTVFVCNSRIHMEADGAIPFPRDDIGEFGKFLPPNTSPLGRSYFDAGLGILEEYSKRTLTYDSDALNAVLGTLGALQSRSPPVYHIWGIPFARKMWVPETEITDTEVALYWYHPSPVIRRVGFPTWSPLGWKGSVTFYETQFQPISPKTCKVEIRSEKDSYEDSVLINDGSSAAAKAKQFNTLSQCLQITAVLFQPAVEDINQESILSEFKDAIGGLHFVFHIPRNDGFLKTVEEHDIYLRPIWDTTPSSYEDQEKIYCAMLAEDSNYALVLRKCEGFYERIGIVSLYRLMMDAGRSQVLIRDSTGAIVKPGLEDARVNESRRQLSSSLSKMGNSFEKTFLLR